MSTVTFTCGCSITFDMFSDKILNISVCFTHRGTFQAELKDLAERIQKEEHNIEK